MPRYLRDGVYFLVIETVAAEDSFARNHCWYPPGQSYWGHTRRSLCRGDSACLDWAGGGDRRIIAGLVAVERLVGSRWRCLRRGTAIRQRRSLSGPDVLINCLLLLPERPVMAGY
jgi:hypothetical protein